MVARHGTRAARAGARHPQGGRRLASRDEVEATKDQPMPGWGWGWGETKGPYIPG
jgi:hypothetical protein